VEQELLLDREVVVQSGSFPPHLLPSRDSHLQAPEFFQQLSQPVRLARYGACRTANATGKKWGQRPASETFCTDHEGLSCLPAIGLTVRSSPGAQALRVRAAEHGSPFHKAESPPRAGENVVGR